MAQALDLCDALDPAGGALGVAKVDAYHVWWDPQLRQQIERAGRGPEPRAGFSRATGSCPPPTCSKTAA
ncbi:MAG: hypothetical protein U1F49_05690 [Rubrivivax sp.]